MKGIINGLKALIDIFKLLFSIIGSIFSTLGLVITYVIKIVDMALGVVATLPDWLQAFGIITVGVSVAYFLIGRNAGKSD